MSTMHVDGRAGAPGLVAAAPAHRSWILPVVLTLGAILICCGVGVGAFFVGQSTRPSGADVNARVTAAHSAQAASDRTLYAARTHDALVAQSRHLHKLMNKRVTAAQQTGYANGQSAGYASGQQQGYSSGEQTGLKTGHAKGRRQGRKEGYVAGAVQGYDAGFNDGSCSAGDYGC